MRLFAKSAPPIEHTMGGGWGSAIHWSDWDGQGQFHNGVDLKALYECYGWKSPLPKKGDTLRAEFNHAWWTFKFVEVRPCNDPKDMFFAKVKPLKREPK